MVFMRNSVDHPHWPSTARLWRESAALNSWGCTSQRTSPGLPTPCQSPRRHSSAYTFSASWKQQVSLHPSSPLSTGEPLRVYWPAASLSGTGTVVQQTARPSSGQWTQLQKSSVPLSPPSWIFSLHDAPVKLPVSWRTPPIPATVSSSSSSPLHQTAQQLFSPGCESLELNSHHPSLKPHTNPLPPETWTPPPPPPPTLPHHRKKLSNFFVFVQFKVCYTQGSGPVQTTCNTLSSICTRQFHTLLCAHNPTKDSCTTNHLCSCTTNHLTLFPSQLLECFSFCTCTVFVRHLHILYFFSLCIGNHFYK